MKVTLTESDERGAPPGVTWDQVPVGSPFYDASVNSYGVKGQLVNQWAVYLPSGMIVGEERSREKGPVFHLPKENDGIGLVRNRNGGVVSGFAIEKQDVAVTWDDLEIGDVFVDVRSGDYFQKLASYTAARLRDRCIYSNDVFVCPFRRPRGPVTITLTPS